MNSQTEADRIRHYCRHHKLSRPRINWPLIATAILTTEGILYILIRRLTSSAGSFFLLEEAFHGSIVLLCGNAILRLLVQIYQRYAPESLRRQCRCQPSCSEYALLALKKYYWPKALILILRRVVHTCQQPGYKKDYP